MADSKPEAWLRGPISGVPALLQPAAHALIQSREEINDYLKNFPEALLWKKPAGRASVGFHLQHLTGVLDRMLTYSKGKTLDETQYDFLRNEGEENSEISVEKLVDDFDKKVDQALDFFRNTSEVTLTDFRGVGRKQLPSTLIGLLFHAAEHSQRHVGQLMVTVSFLKSSGEN